MKKKWLFIVIICLLNLTACSLGEPERLISELKTKVTGFSRFEHSDFTILYPDAFKAMKTNEHFIAFQGEIGKRGPIRFELTVKTYEDDAPSVRNLLGYSITAMSELLRQPANNRVGGYMHETATDLGVRAMVYYQEDADSNKGTLSVYNYLVPLESKLYILSFFCDKDTYQLFKETIFKASNSIDFKHMPVTAWNTEDVNIETNGNGALAIRELQTYKTLKNGKKVKAAELFKEPWKYYGQAITVKGNVEYVSSFRPIGDVRSEVILQTDDGTLVGVLGMNRAKDGLKVGDRTMLTGLPIGKGNVKDSQGNLYPCVYMVGDDVKP
ncbi:hypothetical protein QJQ58_02845 [Paenibacillus dendritiformis]|uniref:hypothetical protein n=1 Tax=Paenibacillus dendritiformis TaxID=130049 RepID=UPI00248B856C|nr:hypothetical protein [Paenibacillus dendritiformis]WGU95228.1 hypothetical protein QJQ58_02845 [Paenibacillus dendritiformis]